jgi:hypothetical protein
LAILEEGFATEAQRRRGGIKRGWLEKNAGCARRIMGRCGSAALPGFEWRTVLLLFIALVLPDFSQTEKLTVMFSAELVILQDFRNEKTVKIRAQSSMEHDSLPGRPCEYFVCR